MSRWRLAILALILLGLSAVATRYAWEKRARGKREAAYQSALRSYSEVLRPGMSRKNVEDYLRVKGVRFTQTCCILEPSGYADLILIGKEGAPWFCSGLDVNVAFVFAAEQGVSPASSRQLHDSDTLKNVTIFRQPEGCL